MKGHVRGPSFCVFLHAFPPVEIKVTFRAKPLALISSSFIVPRSSFLSLLAFGRAGFYHRR
jgi:hypothetical protein